MMRVWLLPIWILALFTGAKSFRDNPVIGSRILNRLGLHAIRVVVAHAITRFRWLLLSPLADRQLRQSFQHDGFVVVPNYLPQEQFELVSAAARACRGEAREMVQGDTITHRVMLDEDTLDNEPVLKSMARLPAFRGVLKWTAAKNKMPLLYVQRIKNRTADTHADPQRTLHSDTFHPTMKAWLFLDDVDDTNGPFTYVPRSHRLTWARLVWEYRRSIRAKGDRYSQKGSLRIDEADLSQLGLDAPRAFSVPRNTLVIANTHGFHRRGPASEPTIRTEIWAYSRENPFSLWPGLDLSGLRRMEQRVIKAYLRHLDRKATRRGTLPSWRLSRQFDHPLTSGLAPSSDQTTGEG